MINKKIIINNINKYGEYKTFINLLSEVALIIDTSMRNTPNGYFSKQEVSLDEMVLKRAVEILKKEKLLYLFTSIVRENGDSVVFTVEFANYMIDLVYNK